MKMKNLWINRNQYTGAFTGRIEFEGEAGAVTVNLSPDASGKMMAVVADAMVGAAREVAERLTAECLAATPAPVMKIG